VSDVTTVVVKVDEQGNIINSMSGTNIGLSVDNPVEFDLIINKVPAQQAFEIRKYKVAMDGFKPKLVLKDGETPPVIPEPELTLAQKVELLEKTVKEQQQEVTEFKESTNYTVDFLSEELFKTQMMKEGM